MHFNFLTEPYIHFRPLEFNECYQETICSNGFGIHVSSCHTKSCMCIHMHTNDKSVNSECFYPLGTRLDPHWRPILSNSTQAKNRSHAEAQNTLHQPVHITASEISRDHVILKGGSGSQMLWKPWDGVDTVASLRLLRHCQASQITTGKSTWMHGWSSFIIP